jgi:hypothetical protein
MRSLGCADGIRKLHAKVKRLTTDIEPECRAKRHQASRNMCEADRVRPDSNSVCRLFYSYDVVARAIAPSKRRLT